MSDWEWSLNNLRSLGLLEFFDVCICGDMVTRSKPNSELFLTAAAGLETAPESCLVLEDIISGVQAVLSGAFPIIMVPDLTQPDPEHRLTAKCDSLLDVIDILKSQR